MTLCTVASHHACNVVMIEAILCAASLSLSYTATCYDISGCIVSCWCMRNSKCKDSTLHIQAEHTQIQWKQPLLVCCFHDVYNIMARRICINRFWLASDKAIILIGFPFYTCINTATCYDISGCIVSCWCMRDSKCKDSTLHIQAEHTQIQWKQPLLVCCFHDVYNIMARRICIN